MIQFNGSSCNHYLPSIGGGARYPVLPSLTSRINSGHLPPQLMVLDLLTNPARLAAAYRTRTALLSFVAPLLLSPLISPGSPPWE